MSRTLKIADLEDAAAKFGATIEQDSDTCLQAVAADGTHWIESDAYHIAIVWGAEGYDQTRQQAFRDALARINCGTRPMTDDEREVAGDS